MFDLFSAEGITAWQAHLADSEEFARAAGSWSGTMLLIEGSESEPSRATWLEVTEGTVRAARPAMTADRAAAEFVLAASAASWQAIVTGKTELIGAAMRGELHLVSGSVFRLLPHARAASAMLRAAGDP
jgi:putative sterol carrier protein